MSGFFIAVISVAVILGFMILIHEFGHYAVAKLLGVRVEQFAIGFGKRLVGFRRGETDYRINLLPLGGYVKMSGENPMDERSGDPREFLSHSRWHRFLIAIAGPMMNILLAVVLLTIVYVVHYEYPIFLYQPATIAWVKPDSPAGKAGIQAGDQIIRLDGIENPTWEQVEPKVFLSPNQPLDVTIQRGNQTLQRTIVPIAITSSEVGSAGWDPNEPVVVGDLEAGMPAERAGIQKGDQIVAVNGQRLPSIEAMIEKLQEIKAEPADFTVLRDGKTLTFRLQAVLAPTEELNPKRYRVGFQPTTVMVVGRLPYMAAFSRSVEKSKENSLLILELVRKMIERKISMRSVDGPIGIAVATGRAASEKGWTPLLELSSAISLNLGVVNLLPIPILDGGVILLLFIESLMQRDISLAIKERIYQAAFVFLVLFAVVLIYNDLAKTLPGMMHRLP
jgi:regulator of sigma E protease